MTKNQQLQQAINKSLYSGNYVDRGVQFLSQYYGVITATNVTHYGNEKYSIYGYDVENGLPRDCYFPRDLEWLGFPIDLDTLLLSLEKLNNYELKQGLSGTICIIFGSWKINWKLAEGLLFQDGETLEKLYKIFINDKKIL